MKNYHPNVIPHVPFWRRPGLTMRRPTEDRKTDTYLKGAALVNELKRWYSPHRPFFEGDLADKWGESPEWAPLSAVAMQLSNVAKQPISSSLASKLIRAVVPKIQTKKVVTEVEVTRKIKRKKNETWFRIGESTKIS